MQAPADTSAAPHRLGLLIAAAVLLLKLPFVFTTLGEQDQGRLIMDAVVYVSDGPATLRNYGIFTSPLWTLPLAGWVKLFGTANLVLITNLLGLLCGGATTYLGFLLLRRLGVDRGWSAAGAVLSGFLPGTFYISLYGYPSQFALPFVLAPAVAFARSLDTKRLSDSILAGVLYCGLVLAKLDFAAAGSLLFAVAIVKRRTLDPRALSLPLLPLLAFGLSCLVASFTIDGKSLIEFLTKIDDTHPWRPTELVDAQVSTIFYAMGFGTLAVMGIALLFGATRRAMRDDVLRIGIAWLVAAVPLILFWLGRPPMSTRHTLPSALMTGLFAALLLSKLPLRFRFAPGLATLLLVGLNWPFGTPGHDFQYDPSGNLSAGLVKNRRAYEVVHQVARQIADSKRPTRVVLGPPDPEVLGHIDFFPAVMVEMAMRSQTAQKAPPPIKGEGGGQGVTLFEDASGKTTLAFTCGYPDPFRELTRMGRFHYFAPYGLKDDGQARPKVKIRVFDPEALFLEARGEYLFW